MALKTPISMLQELMVATHKSIPEYVFRSIGNELEPKFSCTVTFSTFTTVGVARNKKDAKQIAAEQALIKLGYEVPSRLSKHLPEHRTSPNHSFQSETLSKGFIENKNYIGLLNEFASRNAMSYPEYEDPLFAENGLFKYVCRFQGRETVGYAPNKKQAKQVASFKMLSELKTFKPLTIAKVLPQKKPALKCTEEDMNVLKIFEGLSFTEKKTNQALTQIEANPEIKKEKYSMEEAKGELAKRNVSYELTGIQEEPLVIVLKSENMTLLGVGSSKEEAIERVLNDALDVLREGCTSIP